MTPRRVVTLPPDRVGDAAEAFAVEARSRGADILEVRNDLHADGLDVRRLSRVMDVLVSERGRPLAAHWLEACALVDVPREAAVPEGKRVLLSFHADGPMDAGAAVAEWRATRIPKTALVKHVEPLGPIEQGARLLEVQRALAEWLGPERVTVLAMGPLALPFRCVLARRNALDYLALEPRFFAALGQRLLADAVREAKADAQRMRLGILGSSIAHSMSPRIHPQPFDRIDLPPDADVGRLVDALAPWYRGFAVTSPFKKPLARHLGSELDAINTLYRRGGRWVGANTDIEGAVAVLERLPPGKVTVLGDGGVAPALRQAASRLGRPVEVLKRAEAEGRTVSGAVVWTWPEQVGAPEGLRFSGADVAIIAYGRAAVRLAAEVARRAGRPKRLGPRWFVRQARAQRALWNSGDGS